MMSEQYERYSTDSGSMRDSSSRYSETLNALIGQTQVNWTPNSIQECEGCDKKFTFLRRRHREYCAVLLSC